MIRPAILALAIAALPGLAAPAGAQEPEIIILDPNHPMIQEPGTVRPAPEAGAFPAEAPAGEAEVVPLPAQGVDAREILSGLWFRYRAFLAQGDAEQAGRVIAQAIEFMKREGLRASTEIAGAFLAEGRRAMDEGDHRRARENYRLAAQFAPEWPAARFGLAAATLWGERDPAGAVASWWAGVRVGLRDLDALYGLLGALVAVLALGLGTGAGAALLILAVRSAPALAHDLHERSGGRLSEDLSRLAAWFILLLPVLLMVPLPWAVAVWGALIFSYLARLERIAAAIVLAGLMASGPAAHLVGWNFRTAADPAARALINSARAGPDLGQEAVLRELAQQYPREAIFPFLLAVVYRTGGRIDEAMTAYRTVLEIDPGHARALVNLGNLHALRQEYGVAQTFYKKASETDPRLAIAHYDSHLAHLETFHLEAADRELREARRLDEGLIASLIQEGADGGSRRVPRDAMYAAGEIVRRAFRLRLEGGIEGEARRAATAPATLAGAAGLLGALLWPGLGIAPRKAAARRCRRCGRAFCRRCQAGKHREFCSQCVHLYVLRDGLAPAIKAKKLEEVARHRRRMFVGTRLFSLALPGAGHILGGRTLLGTSLLMGWSAAWFGFLLAGRLLVAPEAIAPAAGVELLLPLLGLGLPAWLIGNLTRQEGEAD